MNWEKWCLRIGAGAVIFALAVRIFSGGVAQAVVTTFANPNTAAALLFLETGRILRPAPTEDLTEEAISSTVSAKEKAVAVFAPEDAQLVQVHSICGYDTDLTGWLATPLSWELKKEEPTVLIVHSHGTESYDKTENYDEYTAYRTRDNRYNVVSIGEEIKKVLQAGGISVIHDTTRHDDPSYSKAYANARKSIQDYLEKYPSIQMVLDIHRDSVENKNGKQVHLTAKSGSETTAQLMMVVGTDVNLKHPSWPENMALAVKLHAQLEKNTPGICRPISFRKQRFNQDLSGGALIVEIGSAGNTRQEALLAGRLLAEGILDLAYGTG